MFKQLAALAAAVAAMLALAGTASAQTWAAPDAASVRPGVQTVTDGGQCTANFVFSDGTSTYLGQAAHCASTSDSTSTNGCEAESLPLGTTVEIEDARNPGQFPTRGRLAYSSWLTMRSRGEDPSSDACAHNDFALVELPAGTTVNPTVPFWGGPTGVATSTRTGQDVFSYGNSSLRAGIEVLKPKRGMSLGSTAGGWSHDVYTLTPGIPGDSGSGFLDDRGRAFGTLSTLAVAPLPGSNGVGDLSRGLAYMRAHAAGFSGVTLQEGTEPFTRGRRR